MIINSHQINSATDRISSLDGLRGFAVLVVFLSHTLGIPKGGELGVDVFFVMSGYFISTLLFDEINRKGTINLWDFYWKRSRRLIPAFFAMCVMYFAMSLIYPASAVSPNWGTMLGLLLTSNIYWAAGSPPIPFLQHTWSLAVEWQFYLAWPILLMCLFAIGLRKLGFTIFLIVAVTCVLIARSNGDQLLRIDGILIGSVIPLIKDYKWFRQSFAARGATWYLFVPSLVAIVVLVSQPVASYLGPTKPLVSALTALVICYVVGGQKSVVVALIDNRFLRHFGKISYGLYLYHFPIAALMYVHGMTPALMLLAGVLISIPIAEVSWRYMERLLIHPRKVKTAS